MFAIGKGRVQKTKFFVNYGVSARTCREGVEAVWTLFGQWESILCGRILWTAHKPGY